MIGCRAVVGQLGVLEVRDEGVGSPDVDALFRAGCGLAVAHYRQPGT